MIAVPKYTSVEMFYDTLTVTLDGLVDRKNVRAIWISPTLEEQLWQHSLRKSGERSTLKERKEDEQKRLQWEVENGGIAARVIFWGIPIFASKVFVLSNDEEEHALLC
jgi:hypothetical protein